LSHDFVPPDSEVGLSLKVDTNGKAEDVKVIKGSNPYWDARVVDAIQKSHFRPGTIDNQAIPMDVNLTVVIAH
jgi:TonB family protein